MNGRNNKEENSVLRNNTGNTALSFNALFLKTSYRPNKAADRNANANHILMLNYFDIRKYSKCCVSEIVFVSL